MYCLIRDCKKICTNSIVLTDHLLNKHCSSKEGILHCPLFHHVTSTDCNNMIYHICFHHTGDKPYHCPDCTSTFNLEANLNEHYRVHHQVQNAYTMSC